MNVDLAIFDLGATTLVAPDGGPGGGDDPETRCLRAALAAAGLAVSREAVRALRPLSRLQALRVLVAERAELRERVGAIHLDAVARLLAFYRSDPALREAPGLPAALRALRRAGVRVALASGLPRETTEALLGRLGWIEAGLLDATIAADETRPGAGGPDALEALLRHFGVTNAGRAAVVSDAPGTLARAASAGFRFVIALAHDPETAAELADARCTHRVASLREAAEILGVAPG